MFKSYENVHTVNIGSDVNLIISALGGPDVENISITGKGKSLETICAFIDTALPNLHSVTISHADIADFKDTQICTNVTSFRTRSGFGQDGVEVPKEFSKEKIQTSKIHFLFILD